MQAVRTSGGRGLIVTLTSTGIPKRWEKGKSTDTRCVVGVACVLHRWTLKPSKDSQRSVIVSLESGLPHAFPDGFICRTHAVNSFVSMTGDYKVADTRKYPVRHH